jgi:exosome complex RNA-binding protein Rrp42 (RNase PH superfamily)
MCRPTKITKDILSKNALGSCLVRLGKTQVICGITIQVGIPSIPNHGDILVLGPHGQNSHNSSEMTEILQDVLSSMIDLSCLGIDNGPTPAAWRLQVTFQILFDDGNILDASIIAAVTAMMDIRLPPFRWNNNMVEILENGSPSSQSLSRPLIWHYHPVPLTLGIYVQDNETINLLADPTPEEEPILNGYITMIVAKEKEELVFFRHSSQVGISRQDLAICAHMTHGRWKEISDLWKD